MRGLKLGLSLDFCHVKADPVLRALVAAAARRFEQLGAIVEEVRPLIEPLQNSFEPLWIGSFATRLRQIPSQLHGKLDPGFRAAARRAWRSPSPTTPRPTNPRAKLARDMALWHQKYDLLLAPVTPTAAPPVETLYNSDAFPRWTKGAPFTLPFNLTGQPAASMPAGLTAAGLPVGLQIVGAPAPTLVLKAMRAYESASGWTWPQAESAGRPGPDCSRSEEDYRRGRCGGSTHQFSWRSGRSHCSEARLASVSTVTLSTQPCLSSTYSVDIRRLRDRD